MAVRWVVSAGYPAAIAAAYVLTKYLDAGLPLAVGLRATVVAVALALMVTAAAVIILADLRRGALMGSVLVLLVLTFHQPRMAALFSLLALAVLVERLLARLPRYHDGIHIRTLHRALPAFAAAMLVVIVVQLGARNGLMTISPAMAESGDGGPDIWVLLLDGYPRNDVLEEVYGGRSTLVAGLADLGFDVAPRSRSNYLGTAHTLPSMLDMRLLDKDFSPTAAVLRNNLAFTLLRERGYEVVAFANGHPNVDLRAADRFIDAGTIESVEVAILEDSALRGVIDSLAPTFVTGQLRAIVEHNLAGMVALAREDAARPRFVWVHLPSPHAPALFTAAGDTLPARLDGLWFDTVPGGSADDHREVFLGSLSHLDTIALEAVREVIAATGGNAVVIVMSDHGTRSTGQHVALTPADVHERFATLFAAYTPGHPDLFGETVTPVNVLPILFDAYLGTSLPRQPGRLIDLMGNEHPDPDS